MFITHVLEQNQKAIFYTPITITPVEPIQNMTSTTLIYTCHTNKASYCAERVELDSSPRDTYGCINQIRDVFHCRSEYLSRVRLPTCPAADPYNSRRRSIRSRVLSRCVTSRRYLSRGVITIIIMISSPSLRVLARARPRYRLVVAYRTICTVAE